MECDLESGIPRTCSGQGADGEGLRHPGDRHGCKERKQTRRKAHPFDGRSLARRTRRWNFPAGSKSSIRLPHQRHRLQGTQFQRGGNARHNSKPRIRTMKLISSFALLLCASTFLIAQTPTAPPRKTIRPRTRAHRVLKPAASATPSTTPKTSEDFFVGEARIDVTKDETVVRLAMAQHGSILIELPANDGPRYIIPGDPEMATVDEKALERNKRAIVVRPGTQFVPPQHNTKARNPAATVTAQMRSGLVVTFLFYPVEDLAQNVHRCVLNYNRDEVVARRRAAGLPVNLDDKEQGGAKLTAQSTAAPTSTEAEKSKGNETEQQE